MCQMCEPTTQRQMAVILGYKKDGAFVLRGTPFAVKFKLSNRLVFRTFHSQSSPWKMTIPSVFAAWPIAFTAIHVKIQRREHCKVKIGKFRCEKRITSILKCFKIK